MLTSAGYWPSHGRTRARPAHGGPQARKAHDATDLGPPRQAAGVPGDLLLVAADQLRDRRRPEGQRPPASIGCSSGIRASPAGPRRSCASSSSRATGTDPDYSTYRRPAKRRRPGALAGDATPAYLFWPHAMERMRAYRPGHAADGLLPRPDRARDLALGDGAPAARVLPRPADGDRAVRPRRAPGVCRRGGPEPHAATVGLLARSLRRSAGACAGTVPDRAVDCSTSSASSSAATSAASTGPPTCWACRASRPTRPSTTGWPPRPRSPANSRPWRRSRAWSSRYADDLVLFERLSGLDTEQLADPAGHRRHARDRGTAREALRDAGDAVLTGLSRAARAPGAGCRSAGCVPTRAATRIRPSPGLRPSTSASSGVRIAR